MREATKDPLQTMLNLIPAYTWYANRAGVVTFVNERLANYHGLPKDNPLRSGREVGESWNYSFLHPDDCAETHRLWAECLETGCAVEMTFRIRNAEGGYGWFLSRAEPLLAADGTLQGWIGVNLEAFLLRQQIDAREAGEAHDGRGRLLTWQARKVQNYIDANITGQLLVADLCALIQRSEAHFSRYFTRTFGAPPRAFVIRRRVELAAQYMLSTDGPSAT